MDSTRRVMTFLFLVITAFPALTLMAQGNEDTTTLRVFIFAGQSNMVGSDSKVRDIKRFPPFAGLEEPQSNVKFSYSIGRENKKNSDGWVDLQAVNNVVGPELSFARHVTREIKAPIAIIKVAENRSPDRALDAAPRNDRLVGNRIEKGPCDLQLAVWPSASGSSDDVSVFSGEPSGDRNAMVGQRFDTVLVLVNEGAHVSEGLSSTQVRDFRDVLMLSGIERLGKISDVEPVEEPLIRIDDVARGIIIGSASDMDR